VKLATVLTRAHFGLEAPAVRVEVYCGPGLPQLTMVGLAEAAVRESRDRVRAALAVTGYEFPAGRVTVNLAPADLPKGGGRFDLAIALGILAASGQLPEAGLAATEFYGELSLSGDLRAVRGTLVAAAKAAADGHRLVVPEACLGEARAAGRAPVAGAASLLAVCTALAGGRPLVFGCGEGLPAAASAAPDLVDVRGQAGARRALEVAAAGRHGLLLTGPPGAGKSMLAVRLPGILPPLERDEALETAMVHAVAHELPAPERWRAPPFRAPHHGASAAAVIGGGANPRPGEVSLAHNGVLFLDELPEFRRDVLEALREPLEAGEVRIARAGYRARFPARFQLVAAMNPCPCGYAGEPGGRCRCGPGEIQRYATRISGPLLDRIDLHVTVRPVDYASLHSAQAEASAAVAARVLAARERQRARGALNCWLAGEALERACDLAPEGHRLLAHAAARLGLSARACHRALRVARSIADLAGAPRVGVEQLTEALGYRPLGAAVVE
jgi:magnesium chelatase family protein